MNHRVVPALASFALLVAACGGGDDADDPGVAVDGTGADAPAVASADTNGDGGWFDAGALGSDVVAAVHVQPLDRSAGEAPPVVEPVVDTCAALPADAVTAVADEADAAFLGRTHAFVASPLGAACDYTYETHVIRVVIGSASQVSASPDSPALVLPAGAGTVTESASPDGADVVILSEDSFGLDTPFGAVATTDTASVLVLNRGGTGIDYNVDGLVFSRIAAAAAEGVSTAPAPTADAVAQMAVVAPDPCSIWSVAEIDAFFGLEPITRSSSENVTDGCRWSSDEGTSQLTIMALAPGSAGGDSYVPAEDGSPFFVNAINGRVQVATDTYVVEIRAFGPTDQNEAANLALAQNLVDRVAS